MAATFNCSHTNFTSNNTVTFRIAALFRHNGTLPGSLMQPDPGRVVETIACRRPDTTDQAGTGGRVLTVANIHDVSIAEGTAASIRLHNAS